VTTQHTTYARTSDGLYHRCNPHMDALCGADVRAARFFTYAPGVTYTVTQKCPACEAVPA
jgi:hypothetical protein